MRLLQRIQVAIVPGGTKPRDNVIASAPVGRHQRGQSLRVVSWGWHYLSIVLDEDSRYLLVWTIGTTMKASDVIQRLDLARAKGGVDEVAVVHRLRLLSDNSPCYVSGELATYLGRHGMEHTRGARYHPPQAYSTAEESVGRLIRLHSRGPIRWTVGLPTARNPRHGRHVPHLRRRALPLLRQNPVVLPLQGHPT
ncbi:MAG: DDE-type integrase/transposase/recombinase [Candidatus Binatia bacterium]|nr:DDE-type integrase/transposase/recombinase [Candidatus Binatia bacterium]